MSVDNEYRPVGVPEHQCVSILLKGECDVVHFSIVICTSV